MFEITFQRPLLSCHYFRKSIMKYNVKGSIFWDQCIFKNNLLFSCMTSRKIWVERKFYGKSCKKSGRLFLKMYWFQNILTLTIFQKQPLTTSEVIADSVIGNNNSKQPQYQSAQVPSNPPSSYYLNHLRVRKQSLTYRGAMLSIPRCVFWKYFKIWSLSLKLN